MLGNAEAGERKWLVLYLEKMGSVWVRSGNILASAEECPAEEKKARAGGRYQLKSGCLATTRAQWFLGEWINCGAMPEAAAGPAEPLGTQIECLQLKLWASPDAKSPWPGEPLHAGQEVLLHAKMAGAGKKGNLKVQFYANAEPLVPMVAVSATGQASLRVKLAPGRALYSAVLFQGQEARCFSGVTIVSVLQ